MKNCLSLNVKRFFYNCPIKINDETTQHFVKFANVKFNQTRFVIKKCHTYGQTDGVF